MIIKSDFRSHRKGRFGRLKRSAVVCYYRVLSFETEGKWTVRERKSMYGPSVDLESSPKLFANRSTRWRLFVCLFVYLFIYCMLAAQIHLWFLWFHFTVDFAYRYPAIGRSSSLPINIIIIIVVDVYQKQSRCPRLRGIVSWKGERFSARQKHDIQSIRATVLCARPVFEP